MPEIPRLGDKQIGRRYAKYSQLLSVGFKGRRTEAPPPTAAAAEPG